MATKNKKENQNHTHDNSEVKQNKVTIRRLLRYFIKKIPLNIGTFIFGLLFLYMVISIIMYITADHIESYMVTAGPLAKNQTYTALALREEIVVSADASGYITYYASSNTKVSENGTIYTIGATEHTTFNAELTESDYSRIRASLASFSSSYDSGSFNETYSYKYELEGTIQQYAGLSAPDNSTGMSGVSSIGASPVDGVVLYSMDGYENLDISNLSKDWFDRKNYKFTNLKKSGLVSAGDNIYKLITDESWSIVIPLTTQQVVQLAQRTTIRVKFLKDDATQVGKLTILKDENKYYYAQITFSNGMIRYANDRFLDIELVTNLKSGLKIPLTSIVKKDFFVVPKEYIDEVKGSDGFTVITGTNDAGEMITQFVDASIYTLTDDDFCYVDTSTFKEGDVILKPDSQSTYTLKDTQTWDGVFCINKGYAVFRRISILEQNDEYCIVAVGTRYGIAQFDYIVRNGDSVNEDDILYD